MEEIDNILIQQLKSTGVTVRVLEDLDSAKFLECMIKCFAHIAKMLKEDDNFIDIKYLQK